MCIPKVRVAIAWYATNFLGDEVLVCNCLVQPMNDQMRSIIFKQLLQGISHVHLKFIYKFVLVLVDMHI